VETRNYMNSICNQLADSGYEFFGGGGLAKPTSAKTAGDTSDNAWDALASNGYTVLNDRADILSLISNPTNKVMCNNAWLQDSAAMPYDVDFGTPAASNNVTLAEMTEVAIACLKDDPQGFFIMVEGGKIDWACHANDAMAAIGDMLDFDDAVGKAIEFYNAHPNDTLIIVTGDHETGGMTIGHATTGYSENYSGLTNQTCSFTYFGANQWQAHKAAYAGSYDWTKDNLNSSDVDAVAFIDLISNCFGLVWADLNDYQKEKLEDAYDKSMVGANNNSSAENNYLYGSYEPIIVTVTHVLNENGSIGWTSYSHTGVPVPVYATGFESWRFAGFYDNTDIAKQIAAAIRVSQSLPIQK
jgi:alkaline phosphatase